jgi:repressor LexA
MQQERASKKQQELLSFVDGFIKGNGYGPSYREIMRALGYKSVSTVAIHVEGLIAKGYLARRDKSARSLEVVTARRQEPAEFKTNSNDFIQHLSAKINATELTSEQKRTVKSAMELLGFTDIATSLNVENEKHEQTFDA